MFEGDAVYTQWIATADAIIIIIVLLPPLVGVPLVYSAFIGDPPQPAKQEAISIPPSPFRAFVLTNGSALHQEK